MMKDPAYPAARAVAPTVEAYFVRHRVEARRRVVLPVAPIPDAATIEAIIDAAFWASLRREETYVPKISLPLKPHKLVRVAPAVERAGIHLGVWRNGQGDLQVWGTVRAIPSLSIVV